MSNDEQTPASPSRHRSRAHPSISLPEAIERAKTLFEKDGLKAIPLEVALKHWDYSASSSSGMRVAAALIQYGLMNDEGSGKSRRVRLTPRSRKILQHPDAEARKAAIQEAALLPTLHTELWDKNGGELPSDAALRWELVDSGDLNENSVDSFIENLNATFQFADLTNQADLSEDEDREEDEDSPRSVSRERNTRKPPDWQDEPQPLGVYDLPILLPTGQKAILRMPDHQSPETYRHLVNALKMNLRLMVSAVTRDTGSGLQDDHDLWEKGWSNEDDV